MKLLKKLIYIFTVLCLFFSLFSCNKEEDSEGYDFKDSTGECISLESKPVRVAVLFSSFADIWTEAGGNIAVTVGESVERGIVDEGVILVDSGSGHTLIDTETLIASKPDFVIATADYPVQVETVLLMRKAGIPSALFSVETFEDYLSVLKIFTDILGTGEIYEEQSANMRESIADTLSKARSLTENANLSMLFVRAGSSARSTKAKRKDDHFGAAMLEEMGLYNIADDATVLLDGLSLEHIITEDPDCIFVTFMGNETAARNYINTLFASDGYSSLSAVKEGRVYYLSRDLFHYKPNGAWCEAYDTLYSMLISAFANE